MRSAGIVIVGGGVVVREPLTAYAEVIEG